MVCWEKAPIGDHPQRCVLAHYLADLESDLDREIAWDERALAEHAHIGDGELAHVGISSALGMKPSLHLNLGDGYLRRGDKTLAWEQLEAGLDCAHALKPDGYGVMIRNPQSHSNRHPGLPAPSLMAMWLLETWSLS